MIRTRNKLTILHDDNSVFADYSNEALDYGRDNFTVELGANDDSLYVGYYKPINSLYVELATENTNAGTFSGEYYNGTAFTALAGFHDDSKSFQRSGFIQFDRNQSDEQKTTINGIELYWYKFNTTVTHSATVIAGINIVFADDEDLKREFYEVSKWLPNGEISHILTHVAARDQIVQEIRNNGNRKRSNLIWKDITPFDLLDAPQIKLAATYLALSKIFATITDDPDDTYRQKSNYYLNLYNGALKVFWLSLDADDDGVLDNEERLTFAHGRLVRR